MIYAGFALLMALAAFAILLPWRGRADAPDADDTADGTAGQSDPLSVYRQQLNELDRDIAEGRLDAESGAAARLEIQRRILALNPKDDVPSKPLPQALAVGLAGVLLAGGAGLYLLLGAPEVPSQPGQRVRVLDEQLTEGGPTYGDAIAVIEQRLAVAPDDIEGWELLGRTALSVGAYQKAITAFRRRADLGDPSGRWKVQELEAYLALAGGGVSPAALLVADELSAAHPEHPAGPFYRGLAALQAGDAERAYSIWQRLADASEAGAPWLRRLEPQLERLRSRLGLPAKTGAPPEPE